MDLRYRLAVVTGAGGGLGREIAVALSRAGAAVLCTDTDRAEAEETATLVARARVPSWSLPVDVTDETDLQLLAARGRDLGGMDLLVHVTPSLADLPWPEATAQAWSRRLALGLWAPVRLTQLFLEGLLERRGRGDGTPAVVSVGVLDGSMPAAPEVVAATAGLVGFTTSLSDLRTSGGARVMAVVPARGDRLGPARHGRTPDEAARVVLGLLSRGAAGEVVELAHP